MILNGKAKEGFWKWYLSEPILKFNKLFPMHKTSGEKVIRVNFLAMSETCQNALIIEWFDSVDIMITISSIYYDSHHFNWLIFDRNLNTIQPKNGYETRSKATTEAIKTANEIYNSL